MESAINYPFSVAFIVLAAWSAQLHLSKKKISKSFVTTLLVTSIAFCAAPPDYGINTAIANLDGDSIVSQQQVGITASFSPKQGSTAYIVRLIQGAEKSICVAAYSFTSQPIANALVNAHNKGVDVKVVLDKSQRTAQYSSYHHLTTLNIPTRINSRYAIMHNKFMIIDNLTLQTGSFNYTKAAELHNAENVIVLHDKKIIKEYMSQWQKLWNEAE